MLLGDDDTLWFMLGVRQLLRGYDHTLPYAISDHLGDRSLAGFFVPSPLAAVCAPCHWPETLRAAHMEHLLAHGSAEVSPEEAAAWDPRELDGWGVGRLRTRLGAAGGAAGAETGQAGGLGAAVARATALAADAGGAGDGGGGEDGWGGGPRMRGTGARRAAGGAASGTDDRRLQGERRRQQELQGGGEGGEGEVQERMQHGQRGQEGQQQLLRPWQRQGLRPRLHGQAWVQAMYPLPQSQRTPLRELNVTALLHLAYYGPGSASAAAATSTASPPPVPPPGCPCRPAQACLHRARVCRGVGRGQELCGRSAVWRPSFRGNRSECRHSWAHGGAGVVLSLGLMQAIAGGPAEECARTTQLHSCDMNLALCLMRAPGGGHMFTHPGHAALLGAHWADPRFIVFDNPVYPQVLHDPVGMLTGRVACSRGARDAATAAAAALASSTAFQEDEEGEMGQEGEGSEDGDGVLGDADAAVTAVPPAAVDGVQPGAGAAIVGGDGGGAQASAAAASGDTSARRLLGAEEELGLAAEGSGSADAVQSSPGGGGGGGGPGDEDRPVCEWLLRHAVSLHMHGRSYPSFDAAAEAMRAVARQHVRLARVLRERRQRQGQGQQRQG